MDVFTPRSRRAHRGDGPFLFRRVDEAKVRPTGGRGCSRGIVDGRGYAAILDLQIRDRDLDGRGDRRWVDPEAHYSIEIAGYAAHQRRAERCRSGLDLRKGAASGREVRVEREWGDAEVGPLLGHNAVDHLGERRLEQR